MADIALGAANIVLTKAIDILGNLGVEDGVRLYWLKQDIYWIERQMRFLQSLLKDADADAMHEQSHVATNLMNDIRDLAYDVEDIMDTYMPELATRKRKGFLGWLKSFINCIFCDNSARDFVMEVQAIRRRVDEINSARNVLNVTQSVPGNKSNVGGFAWRKKERIFVGFEEHKRKLTEKLHNKDTGKYVISIVGMPGMGKTTLAEVVFRDAKPQFECSAKVVVSREPKIEELLQDIARQVGLEKEKREKDVEDNLRDYLTGKRYVILLDDIWHTQTWDNLHESIPHSENGSKIIITSRQNRVGLHIGGDSSLYELQPLNLEDSGKLFYEMVMESPVADLSKELKALGDQIVERCGGVPLPIVVTAGLLSIRERTEHAWKSVLDRMGQNKDVLKILALSYQDLDFELKPCFLYFGLFPEDYEVSIFQLINLWVAEGFINLNGERAPEDIGEDYLEELIDRNLIQVCRKRFNGRIKSCRIHDLLHNLCISLAKKSNFNTLNDVTFTPAMSVRRVTTYGDSITSFKYQTPKLRALLFFYRESTRLERKHLKSVLGDLRFLRMLCVECEKLPSSLPNEIGNLSQLGYLRLWGIDLRKLPSTLSNLKNLLTLDVERCYDLLFVDVIWKMKQLRHIIFPKRPFVSVETCLPNHLQGSHILSFRDKIIHCKAKMHRFSRVATCLPNPQTLLHVDGLNLKFHWLRKFTSLRKLGINFLTEGTMRKLCGKNIFEPENLGLEQFILSTVTTKWNLSHYQNLYELRLGGVVNPFVNPFFSPDKLPPNLTDLTLGRSEVEEDTMEILKKLRKLKFLKLVYNSYKGNKIVCSGTENFPNLEVLNLKDSGNLEALIVEERGMPKLNKLQIQGCHPLPEISDWLKTKCEVSNIFRKISITTI